MNNQQKNLSPRLETKRGDLSKTIAKVAQNHQKLTQNHHNQNRNVLCHLYKVVVDRVAVGKVVVGGKVAVGKVVVEDKLDKVDDADDDEDVQLQTDHFSSALISPQLR